MLGLLHRVRPPGKVKVGACALSAQTFITSEHGSDARLRNNVLKYIVYINASNII